MNASMHVPVNTSHTPVGKRSQQRHSKFNTAAKSATLILLTSTLLGCAATTANDAAETPSDASREVTLVVHDSFPNEAFTEAASAATGYDIRVVTAGDGGELTNKLVLTQSAPIGDAFFGVDNVYASRVVDADVVAPYNSDSLTAHATQYLAGENDGLNPITRGATCINIDPAWFAKENLTAPTSYDDLAAPEYAALTVLLDPSSSSTGASFLIGTISKYGETGFEKYWEQLAAGGARIEQSWSAAYNGQFTQGGGDGTYPIVLSYSSSPAWTVTADGTSSATTALLDTCSSQVEYAGVLNGAKNPEGAEAVIDYMLSPEFQNTIAESMYVYPIDDTATVPETWETFATFPSAPNDLTPTEIGSGRETWLRNWSDATGW